MTALTIDVIRLDGGTQARAELDAQTVARYAALIKEAQDETGEQNVWPFKDAVEAYYDGSVYWLSDGFHRVSACRQCGVNEVQADVAQGTQRDAILASFGANEAHGLRRSAEDKRRSVTRMLKDEEWGKWSDREIARRCKVSHPTVATIRKELAEATGKFTSERVYVNKNGDEATMDTARIGSNGEAKRTPVRDEDVYVWLRDYEDGAGRRWHDLEDNQVHHANSPCYQAYVKAFPRQTDPKLLLKRALYRLRREAKEANETTADFAPVPRLFINEVGEFEASQRSVNPDAAPPALPVICPECSSTTIDFYSTKKRGGRVDIEAACPGCKRELHWFGFIGGDRWEYVFCRNPERKTAVTPAQTAYARSEVRHAIAEANREARRYFPSNSPAYFYHGWADMGETHPQYHFLSTAVADYPADVVAEELADLCRCNPVSDDAFLDRAIANMAAEIEEMLAESEGLSAQTSVIEEEMLAFDDETPPDTSDGDEWYTPAWLIEKAKAVMGGIDIDPASSAVAQERVQAAKWFGKDYMGVGTGALNINWVHHNGPNWAPARVWLNPPYSFPLVGQFVEKLLEQIEKGYVREAILLVNNNTETDWWHQAAAAAAVTFAFRSRVFFWRPGREDATSPRQGQTAFYFGDNALQFIEAFGDKGISFMRWVTASDEEE